MPIHLVGNVQNFLESAWIEMLTFFHQANHFCKFQEFDSFERPQRMSLKERENEFTMVFQISHSPAKTVAMIASDHPALHETAELMKKRNVAFVLNDGEFR